MRLGIDRRDDERDVRLGERGTQLLLLLPEQLGQLGVAAGGLVIDDPIRGELSEAANERIAGRRAWYGPSGGPPAESPAAAIRGAWS